MGNSVICWSRSMKGFLWSFLFLVSGVIFAASEPEAFSYISCGTFEYSGKTNFRMQNAGVVDVVRQQLPSGDYGYTIASNTSMMAGDNQANAEIISPPMLLMRDADNRIITGGIDCLKEVGEVGNRALGLSSAKVITDNKWRSYELPMDSTAFYPARPGFKVKYTRVQSRKLGPCVLVTAVSDFFVCSVPGEKQPLTGIYKVVMLSDPSLRNMYYRCSGYEARMGEEQVNAKDNFWLGVQETGDPVDLSDIKAEIDREVGSIFMPDKGVLETNSTVPLWAVHALSVKRYMDVTCGAVIEGQPNFAIVIAIGGILLIDSAVSTASELLAAGVKKATGKDIFVYQGIPNYIGQGVGWGGAKVYETVTGNKANTEAWKSVGGDVGDVGAMFLSPGTAAKGLKTVGKGLQWGVKLVDAKKIDQAIRIGKYALSFTNMQRISKLFDLKTGIQKIWKAWDALSSGGTNPAGSGIGIPGVGPGGSVPGGLTFEGEIDRLAVRKVKYQEKDNSFVINDTVSYASPVSPADMKLILKHIAAEDGFGLSLAGDLRGGVTKDSPFYAALSLCDLYLGNIVFGRVDCLPAGCVPAPNYKPSKAPANNLGTVCAVFNFRCKFALDRTGLKRRSVYLEVALIPYDREKAEKFGIYEYAEPKEKDEKALETYRQNVGHFDAAFYLKQPVVIKVVSWGEAAAFARSLKKGGIDLEALAASITEPTKKRDEGKK